MIIDIRAALIRGGAPVTAAQIPPRISMVTGSGLGLAAPAIRNTPKISTRRHLANRWWVNTPARFSMTMSSGTSNASPNASIIAIAKLRYWSTWMMFATPCGVRPSR